MFPVAPPHLGAYDAPLPPMTLAAGIRLGPYEILAPLGAGGMGEVYKARDTRLDRTVAIKILSSHIATDRDHRARFDREAKALAAINHPHICSLFDVGHQNGTDFLVMEYLDGETVADRLRKGRLPLDEALRHAIDIADALDKAHRAGIIHRDLKPSNIKLTPDGTVKVLDFGLATRVEKADVSTTTAPLTNQSGPAGTLAYMAPEILRGSPANASSDIWSLGVVLHEMATAEWPFHGRSGFDLVDAILHASASPLPASIPAGLRAIITRCLMKDPNQRYRSAAEVRAAIETVHPDATINVPAASRARIRPRIWMLAAIVATVGTVAAAIVWSRRDVVPARSEPRRLRLLVSSQHRLLDPALSPDGKLVAYVAEQESGRFDLFVALVSGGRRVRLTDDEAREAHPTFSPDGQQIVFTRRRPDGGGPEVCIVAALGGEAFVVAPGSWPAWSPDGRQLAFVQGYPGLPRLVTASVAGADLRVLLPADGVYQLLRHPSWSPDGREIAIMRGKGGLASGEIWIVRASGGAPRRVSHDRDPDEVFSASPSFTPDGRSIIHASNRGGATNLWSLPLNGGVPNQLTTGAGPDQAPTVAATGAIAFVNSRISDALLVYQLLTGEKRTLLIHAPAIWGPVFSPDGSRLAFSRREVDGSWHIWTILVKGGAAERLTPATVGGFYPRFSHDGRFILYHTWSAPHRIWRIPSDGGAVVALTSHRTNASYGDLSPDGRWLAFCQTEGNLERIYLAATDGGEARPLRRAPACLPRWSPDGRLIAFALDRAYNNGIFVIDADGRHERRLTDRGGWPVWSPDGRQLAYLIMGPDAVQQIHVVKLDGTPDRHLAAVRYKDWNYPFDISPDGRLLATSDAVSTSNEIWLLEASP
jgi:Tol biopolymer transport system component/tRNA A-37 threonylcarbamoyl transferase component Bud32